MKCQTKSPADEGEAVCVLLGGEQDNLSSINVSAQLLAERFSISLERARLTVKLLRGAA